MELKKDPKVDLENQKGIFLQIGLIVSLLLVIAAYEYKSYDGLAIDGFGDLEMDALDEEDIEINAKTIPLLKDRKLQNGKATAYVCRVGACLPPVQTSEELVKLLSYR